MSYNINNLAIIITKEIETDLIRLCFSNQKDDSLIMDRPSIYMIRESILSVLKKYMLELYIEQKESPMMAERMTTRQYADFVNHQMRRQAAELVGEILNNEECFTKFEFQDEYDYYKSITREIIILKTGLIKTMSEKVKGGFV